MRDNFTEETKRILALRVALSCSNPKCYKSTTYPGPDETKVITIGKAAHITAASAGGPRYDSTLTTAARKSVQNGIWLCSNCADLIDKDASSYSIETLCKWKIDAEIRARMIFLHSHDSNSHFAIFQNLDEADKSFLKRLNLPVEDDIEATTSKLQQSAKDDILTFQNTAEWPSYAINLNLILSDNGLQTKVRMNGLAKIALISDSISINAPPGAGKTITSIQLAENILDTTKHIAVFIPLSEWAVRRETFFEFLINRNAFRNFRPQHFMQLAYYGRLILLLDGLNELDAVAQMHVLKDVKSLKRNFPLLGVITSSRKRSSTNHNLTVEIAPLTIDQQRHLARKLRGKEGESIVERAIRIPGLRELIAIPLYFNTLMASTTTNLPATKEEILNIFVQQHEQAEEKAISLDKELLGFHQDFLIGIAVELNHSSSTTMPRDNALRVISKVTEELQSKKQITIPFQSSKVLDVLVNSHLLICSSENKNFSFQHQQFQELYASFVVENLMIESKNANLQAREMLRTAMLNKINWEESVLFACERLSRKDIDGERAVAATILETLGIDPMLAAEMIFRSSQNVWKYIKDNIIGFVNRWHKHNTVDRAVRFMITSEREDFAEYLWPLISNTDNQVCFEMLRSAEQFRPSVLGPELEERLAKLPEETRCIVLAEISYRSGFDGMELATKLAKIDTSPKVVIKILQSLQSRHAYNHVEEILQTASNEVWQRIAKEGYPDKVSDPNLNEKLTKAYRDLFKNETNPLLKIRYLIDKNREIENAEAVLVQLIKSPDFPVKSENTSNILWEAYNVYPKVVSKAIFQRVIDGLELPYGSWDFLDEIQTVEDGPILAAAHDITTPRSIAHAAYAVLGPVSVGHLMHELFDISSKKQRNELERKKYDCLFSAILSSRQSSFLEALFKIADTKDLGEIGLMSDLLARHGQSHELKQLIVSDEIDEKLTNLVEQWIKVVLTSKENKQNRFLNILMVIERLPKVRFVQDIQKMLESEFGSRENNPNTMVFNYDIPSYRRAFSAIGDDNVVALMKSSLSDLRYGINAAYVLFDIWRKSNPIGRSNKFTPWYDFSEAKNNHKLLNNQAQLPQTCDFSESIFAVVRKFCSPSNSSVMQQHAILLAEVGLKMHYGIKRDEIKGLLALPLPLSKKKNLLAIAANKGEILSSDILYEGLKELCEVSKQESWRFYQNNEHMDWITLFAFSDNPTAVLKAIELLPPEYQKPGNLGRLHSALGQSPNEQALSVLEDLLKRDPLTIHQRPWLDALIEIRTEKSALLLLRLIFDGSFTRNQNHFSIRFVLQKHLTNLASVFPNLSDEIFRQYIKLNEGKPKQILEDVLVEVADTQIILDLIRIFASNNQPFDYRLISAIKKVAIEQRPSESWPGAFELIAVPLTEFRKQLFDMLESNDAESELAEKCLIKIDELRDEYGSVSNEPRHPNKIFTIRQLNPFSACVGIY